MRLCNFIILTVYWEHTCVCLCLDLGIKARLDLYNDMSRYSRQVQDVLMFNYELSDSDPFLPFQGLISIYLLSDVEKKKIVV